MQTVTRFLHRPVHSQVASQTDKYLARGEESPFHTASTQKATGPLQGEQRPAGKEETGAKNIRIFPFIAVRKRANTRGPRLERFCREVQVQ